MSLDVATAKVDEILERLQNEPLVNLAQLPGPDANLQLERALQDCLNDCELNVIHRVRDEYYGDGPLTPLLQDPEVSEILIHGLRPISYEKNGKLELWPDRFLSEVTFRNFLVRLSKEARVQVTLSEPFASARWRGFRLHWVGEACAAEASLTLRRHPQESYTFAHLQALDWAPRKMVEFLLRAVDDRKNVLVIGTTGSGKTSVLNAYLNAVSARERIVTLEDTPELKWSHSLSTQLYTRFDPQGILREITLGELVRQSLRMRPDRLVLGEVRGSEAKDLLLAWATGHRGSWTTLHAGAAREALLRLEMLIQLGAPQWGLQAVRQLIRLSVDLIVHVERRPSGERRLASITRVTSLEETGFLTEFVWKD